CRRQCGAISRGSGYRSQTKLTGRGQLPGAATLRSPAAEVHNDQMFDWNDLRYLLAVARHRSTIAAGKSLGLSQSTVHRRVGEVDVAFRSGDTDDELVGRKIADSIWAVYASRAYVERHGQPARVEDLSLHPLVGFDESLSQHRAAKWLREVVPDAKMSARNTSVLGLVSAVKSGIVI